MYWYTQYLDCYVDGWLDNKCCLGVLSHIIHNFRFFHLTALSEECLELFVTLHNEGIQAPKMRSFLTKPLNEIVKLRPHMFYVFNYFTTTQSSESHVTCIMSLGSIQSYIAYSLQKIVKHTSSAQHSTVVFL